RSRFERSVHNLNDQLVLYQRLRNSLAGADSPSRAGELEAYEQTLAAGLSDFSRMKGRGKPSAALKRLGDFFDRYRDLDAGAYFKPVPPELGDKPDAWASVPADLLRALKDGRVTDDSKAWFSLLDAAKAQDAARFDAALDVLEASARARAPKGLERCGYETLFNRAQPFYRGMVLYVLVFLLAMFSYLGWAPALRQAAFGALAAAFAVHTAGLLSRMWLQGRPPVTNLYSSAVFVGWVTALLSVVLERSSRRGVAAAVGGLAGFSTLLIAHHLAASGDTMEMMRAVLDSNFWLGTHVVTITVGYAGTFMAGLLAHVWILRRWSGALAPDEDKALYRMTYGVVCFALLFSFIGTVLGGIWADQSWGRFWGWDPKENGAFMICLWNAILLHARFGGYVRERGFMVLAVLGDVVTALSWFGVNMLGIGLHSYGFMDKASGWLGAFCAFQLAVAAFAFAPPRRVPRAT
ncbi:MAG: cytochrome c biogenesis protein CcsA, partial [Elusimicrobia bacterium]|nr:cytochrome c biogenesis protein CcsA [Elusimicrobiota bacterium]